MRVYCAPMEGMTGYLYRQVHHRWYHGVDRYYTPFLSPGQDHIFTKRELREIDPAHNEWIDVVPQLLTKRAEDFLWAAGELAAMGYREVNLNLGCPSGTVTAKGKGAGFLAKPEELERFLDQIFAAAPLRISIKTRLGMTQEEEFERLLEIYNRYPICELTIHARVRNDFYKEPARMEYFAAHWRNSKNPVCYNGDLFTAADCRTFQARFPEVEAVMLGRGLAADPALGQKAAGGPGTDKKTLKAFHDELYEGYCALFQSRNPAMMRMKELWSYLLRLFENSDRFGKELRKATDPARFSSVTGRLFRELELREDAVFE